MTVTPKKLVELCFKGQELGSLIHALLDISQFISNRVNLHSYLTMFDNTLKLV